MRKLVTLLGAFWAGGVLTTTVNFEAQRNSVYTVTTDCDGGFTTELLGDAGPPCPDPKPPPKGKWSIAWELALPAGDLSGIALDPYEGNILVLDESSALYRVSFDGVLLDSVAINSLGHDLEGVAITSPTSIAFAAPQSGSELVQIDWDGVSDIDLNDATVTVPATLGQALAVDPTIPDLYWSLGIDGKYCGS